MLLISRKLVLRTHCVKFSPFMVKVDYVNHVPGYLTPAGWQRQRESGHFPVSWPAQLPQLQQGIGAGRKADALPKANAESALHSQKTRRHPGA